MSFKIMFNNIIGQLKICEFDKITIQAGFNPFSDDFDTEITHTDGAAVLDCDDDVWDNDDAMEAIEKLEKNSEVSTLIVKLDEGQIVTYVEKSASDLLKTFNESKQAGEMCCNITACSGYEPYKKKVSSILKAIP
jgi:hypothetical protein